MKKILLVDDDVSTLMALKRHLSRQFDVSTATSAHTAATMFDQGSHFDGVLCDVNMPGLSGFELLQYAQAQHVSARFVFLSGDIYWLSRTTELLGLGATDVLAKPSPIHDIIYALDRACMAEQAIARGANLATSVIAPAVSSSP